jgi:hypothetical protein
MKTEGIRDLIDRGLEFARNVFERGISLFGPAFVALASTLIAYVIYTHFSAVIPFYHQGYLFTASWPAVLHLIISTWLSFNIVFNYIGSVVVSPGIAPADIDEADADSYLVPPEVSSEDTLASEQKFIIKHCKSCAL